MLNKTKAKLSLVLGLMLMAALSFAGGGGTGGGGVDYGAIFDGAKADITALLVVVVPLFIGLLVVVLGPKIGIKWIQRIFKKI